MHSTAKPRPLTDDAFSLDTLQSLRQALNACRETFADLPGDSILIDLHDPGEIAAYVRRQRKRLDRRIRGMRAVGDSLSFFVKAYAQMLQRSGTDSQGLWADPNAERVYVDLMDVVDLWTQASSETGLVTEPTFPVRREGSIP